MSKFDQLILYEQHCRTWVGQKFSLEFDRNSNFPGILLACLQNVGFSAGGRKSAMFYSINISRSDTQICQIP